jgi:predicted short-subunit dehydrogenase-like oxidoreductase (DUF2520 family)
MRAIALVGTGRLAASLARTLGDRIAIVAGRDAARVTEVAAIVGAATSSVDELAAAHFDILWLATSDAALSEVASSIAGMRASWRGLHVVHSSGALGVEPLEPFARRDATVLALHPNASLRGDLPVPTTTIWGVTPPDAVDDARRVLGRDEANIVGIDESLRPLYHAAASAAANFTVTLFAMAGQLYERVGIDPATAAALVAAFMQTSVERSLDDGPQSTITGPVVRGDEQVVVAQRAAVGASAPEVAPAFDALVQLTRWLFRTDEGRASGEPGRDV